MIGVSEVAEAVWEFGIRSRVRLKSEYILSSAGTSNESPTHLRY